MNEEIKDDNLKQADNNPTAQTTAVINQTVPVGTVISYVGNANTFPPGWMECNGAVFNQNQYPALYTALGNSNTLPNLAGYFLRGLDTSGKVDPDGAGRTLLSLQADTFGQHSHNVAELPWFWSEATEGVNYILGTDMTSGLHEQTTTSAGSAETRPKNAAVLYLIFAGLPQQ
jgi:microcystin-dependent protein